MRIHSFECAHFFQMFRKLMRQVVVQQIHINPLFIRLFVHAQS